MLLRAFDEQIKRPRKQLRGVQKDHRELIGDDTTLIERHLIETIVATWLQLINPTSGRSTSGQSKIWLAAHIRHCR